MICDLGLVGFSLNVVCGMGFGVGWVEGVLAGMVWYALLIWAVICWMGFGV